MGCLTCDFLLMTLLLVSVRKLWAQAPGDEDALCITANPQVYPDTVRNLMDSYNYDSLLPGNGTGNPPIATAVWNDFSFDGNDANSTTTPTYWQQDVGGICQPPATVCGWRREGTTQNNWLFTQHISQDFDSTTYNYNVTIRVETTYSVRSCRISRGCRQGFNLLYYMTNTQQLPSTEGSGYMNTQNYHKFEESYAPISGLTYTNTYNFTLPPSSTGFYLALQDNGSCIVISRLRVYRNNCKSRQVGLVLYGDAPSPESNTPIVPVSCVANSFINSNESKATACGKGRTTDTVTCSSDGTWANENVQCSCDCGYEEGISTGTSEPICTPCRVGHFKSMGLDECTICPDNSDSSTAGAHICDCREYFYRNDSEDPTVACTASPSEPESVRVVATNTSLTVAWDPPVSTGGRNDMSFNLSICLVASSTNDSQSTRETVTGRPPEQQNIVECGENTNSISHTGMSYMFEGLRPVTLYRIVVQAENGVSRKDGRVHLRQVVMDVATEEGEPEEVSNPSAVNNVVLVWGPPRVPNGEITGYQIWLKFNASDDEGSGVDNATGPLKPDNCDDIPDSYSVVGPHTLYFVLDGSVLPDCPHNLIFSIRAKTGEDRYGAWSPQQTIVPVFVCPRPTPRDCDCPSVADCDEVSPTATISVIAPTTPPTEPTTEEPSVDTREEEGLQYELEQCAFFMIGSAVLFSIIIGIVSCVFSCAIACICHKHKMKNYKVKVKKHLQSKWDY